MLGRIKALANEGKTWDGHGRRNSGDFSTGLQLLLVNVRTWAVGGSGWAGLHHLLPYMWAGSESAKDWVKLWNLLVRMRAITGVGRLG